MRAISLPSSRFVSIPAYFATLSAWASLSRKPNSPGLKSISLTKLRFRMLYTVFSSETRQEVRCRSPSPPHPPRRSSDAELEGWIALDWASHAVRAPSAAAQFEAFDCDHLNARFAQLRVRVGVALVGNNDAGLDRDEVVAVVPLLPLGLVFVAAGRDHAHLRHAQGGTNRLNQPVLLLLDHEVVR